MSDDYVIRWAWNSEIQDEVSVAVSRQDEHFFDEHRIVMIDDYPGWWTTVNGKPRPVFLHRAVMGFPPGKDVHHVNKKNKCDCRRSNLQKVPTKKHNKMHGHGRQPVIFR